MTETVVVGMSGGVDSSVAAALLVEQGYRVIGVTLRVWPWQEVQDPVRRFGGCCSPEAVDDARRVARQIGIPYYLLNSEKEFDSTVIADFTREYLSGRTPTPCVVCNRAVKFGSLLRRARAWEASAVATGHYARVDRDPGTGRIRLWRGLDPRKDQSYFLWPLAQSQLEGVRFPVGKMRKEEVRAKARALGLDVAEKPESQEICFVPDDDYRGFLRRRTPQGFSAGPILDSVGRVVGRHHGLANYTVGQRKGLGLSAGKPLYVVALDPERNAVIVGAEDDLGVSRLPATQVNFIAFPTPTGPIRVEAKIRSSHAGAPATVYPVEGGSIEVHFDTPQRAVTPGQSVVLYDGEQVIGGGIIGLAPRSGISALASQGKSGS